MDYFKNYSQNLQDVLKRYDWSNVLKLSETLNNIWIDKKQVFLCGNGGSAANAIHIANDFIYGIAVQNNGMGLKVHALPANSAILTCLGNDISYENIYAQQVAVLGNPGDILIVLSGSGNSLNVVKAIEKASEIGMCTSAILGYSGGKCLNLVDIPIHFSVNDMQIAEDCQQIVGHMIMRWLAKQKSSSCKK